jgi:hypothetical protein
MTEPDGIRAALRAAWAPLLDGGDDLRAAA